VEDDPVNAAVITNFLEDYLNTDCVSDGNAAVKVCNSLKYDAVLMDINLKGIDGVETLRQLRKIDNHYANIPVIATTAYAMTGDREKFLSLGFTHYISKPFDCPQLLTLLTNIFKND
jgi:CheY-like chemotaxis protein